MCCDVKGVQSVELEILEEVDRVCRENDIRYFLDSGTALGALRHRGFIPWDDDADIGMMRGDYDKFLRIAPDKLGSKFFLQTLRTDPGCPVMFAKVRMNGTEFIERNKKGMNMHTGIYIDIFPYDFVPSNENERLRVHKEIKHYLHMFCLKKIPHKIKDERDSLIKHLAGCAARKIIHWLLQLVPDSFFTGKVNFLLRNIKSDKSIVSCLYFGGEYYFEYERLFPLGLCEFEGSTFSAVKDMDYYLKTMYGDYMKLPPENERKGHEPLYVRLFS